MYNLTAFIIPCKYIARMTCLQNWWIRCFSDNPLKYRIDLYHRLELNFRVSFAMEDNALDCSARNRVNKIMK
jgi:hypothetical protein